MSKLSDSVRCSPINEPPPQSWRRSELRRDVTTGDEWAIDFDPAKVRCVVIAEIALLDADAAALRSTGWEQGTATTPSGEQVNLWCSPAAAVQRTAPRPMAASSQGRSL